MAKQSCLALHVLQKQAPGLADRRAEQLPPYRLRPDGSNLQLETVPRPVDAAKGTTTGQRRDIPEIVEALLKRADATASKTTRE